MIFHIPYSNSLIYYYLVIYYNALKQFIIKSDPPKLTSSLLVTDISSEDFDIDNMDEYQITDDQAELDTDVSGARPEIALQRMFTNINILSTLLTIKLGNEVITFSNFDWKLEQFLRLAHFWLDDINLNSIAL